MIEKTPLHEAHDEMFRRYNTLMQKDGLGEKKLHSSINYRLTLMAIHAISNVMPIDKVGRWMGFIQGNLYACELINLKEEREISRKIFHKAYEEMGIEVPESIDVVQANFESMTDV